jgi:hypothetical protein
MRPAPDARLNGGPAAPAPAPFVPPPPVAGPSRPPDAEVARLSTPAPVHYEPSPPTNGQRGEARSVPTNSAPAHNGAPAPTGQVPTQSNGGPGGNGQCTAPQLRRFIKSRPYVPMHELRRRFGIVGPDDDVTAVRLDPGLVYLGLPPREGSLLGELLRAGEIGYELSLDPRTPIVIGVYPMRPIPRS